MTFRLLPLSLMLLLLPAAGFGANAIKIVYPAEGDSFPELRNTFIFGNIAPSTAPFSINGQRINVYRNGAFIAYLPVAGGEFSFNCELQNGATTAYVRKIRIKPAVQPRASTGPVYVEVVSPAADLELSAGDFVNVQAEGTPSRHAVFSIKNVVKDAPMSELPAGSGRYFGVYRIKGSDAARAAPLEVKFRSGLFASGAAAAAKGRITILDKFSILETSTESVILRNGIDSGYMMFLPKGVQLASDGRVGNMRRVRLSANDAVWVDDSKVAPSMYSIFLPQTEIGNIRVVKTDTGSSAAVLLPERVPYLVEEKENALRVVLYYTKAHTNRVVYDPADNFVKTVSVSQIAENTAAIDFELAPGRTIWGYEVSYGTRAMIVDIKKAPAVAGSWPKPLSGLRVVLDPGHSPKTTPPYDGAVGPMGTFEYQVNLVTAHKLKASLSSLGADVYLTRKDTETVQLADRPKLAREYKGDIFISLHNNAIGDGEDPFSQPRGFSLYYYHRHSFELARALHRSYARNSPLPDEGLRFGDYHVARMTAMPAVLVESAYMILPEQEEMLNNPSFQQKLADTLTEGLLEFFKVEPRKVKK